MMRILLTGATGFLGSYFLRRLAGENVTVAILVRPQSNLWRITPLPLPVTRIEVDLGRIKEAAGAIDVFQPEALVHCAWSGAGGRMRNDFSQVEDNLAPSLELLRLAVEAGCRTFLGLGSQAEYGPQNRRLNESALTEPTTLYGTAKLSLSWLMRQLCGQWDIRYLWLRVFSTYGPMDDPPEGAPNWLLPSVIRALGRNEAPALTACEQRWDYLYAADAAEAFWEVLRNPKAEGIFNLGSGQARPLREIVQFVRNQINPELPLGFGRVPYREDQVMHLEADITRIQDVTGWKPRTSLEKGLRMEIDWHLKRKDRVEQS
jgi:UDP-glucose 4-epimerase